MNGNRRSGSLLIEVAIALTIFTIGIMGFFSTFRSMAQIGEDMGSLDRVQVALKNAASQMRNADFATLYTNFNGRAIKVLDLQDPKGGSAAVQVTCYIDEITLPQEFGPVLDLDGDGAMKTNDCSGTYKLLPVRLRLEYATSYGQDAREVYMIISGFM